MQANENYQVYDIERSRIFRDDDFNCRGAISAIDIAELAQDIQKNTLQFPITVQPREDAPSIPANYDFRIIAGHRRFTACSALGMQMIPCMVRKGLTDAQARILNLGENLKRKELNIMQEAIALKHLEDAGIPRDSVAKELGMSSGWVQARYYLLRMPKEIQEEAAAGVLNQYQIKQLYSYKTDEEKFEAVKRIKNAKLAGEKPPEVGVRKKKPTDKKKVRKTDELFEMSELIASTLGYGLATRVLAWAGGNITTDDVFADIKIEADKVGKTFFPPEEF